MMRSDVVWCDVVWGVVVWCGVFVVIIELVFTL